MKQDDLQELIVDVSNTFALPKTVTTKDDLLKLLTPHIDQLINHDFNRLITFLYRLDIDENRLRQLLAPSDTAAAEVIASLIIERQLKKIEARKLFRAGKDIPDDERW
jgi:hypothetical protein